MLDFRRLEIFCAVAKTGSITAASSRLHISQSAASQQIALLEREIGASLIERLPRGIRLTEPGRMLSDRASTLLRDLAALEHQMRRAVSARSRIRLGVFATAGAHLAPRVVQKYRTVVPQIDLVLRATQPEMLEIELNEGLIDVGLSWDYDFLPRAFVDLHRWRLLTDPMVILAPRGDPLAGVSTPLKLADLAGRPWVVRAHRAPPYDSAFEILCRSLNFEPEVAFRTDNYEAVQGLVAAGVGLALAPRLSLTALRPDVLVLPLADPPAVRRIEAVALRGTGADPNVSNLVATLEEICAEPPAGTAGPPHRPLP